MKCLENVIEEIAAERDALRAELATLKQAQEPVAWMWHTEKYSDQWLLGVDKPAPHAFAVTPLYTSAPTITEGWQLVPTKTDKNMQHTFIDTYNAYGFESAYRDLLSAAPKPGEPA